MRKNFFYNFLLTGSNLLFPLLTFPYLSRILGAEGLGVCNFILSYSQNYIIIAALGLPIYGIREIAKIGKDTSKRSKLFFELLSIHSIFTSILLIIYAGSIFLYSDFQDYIQLSILGGMLIIFNVFTIQWLFSGVNDFKYITIRSLIIRTLSVLSIFIFVKQKEDFIIYFFIYTLTILLTVVVDVHYARKFISRNFSLSFKGILSHIKPISFLGIYMVLTSIYSILPITLLGFLSTKASVGYFYGANKIIRVVISVFSALTTVMIPKLNQMVEEKQNEDYLMLLNKSLNIIISFGIPLTFFVYLLADPLVMVLAGAGFRDSIAVIQIMAPIILIVAFAQVFVLLILSVNRKDKEMVFLSLSGMVISVLINIIFIPTFAEQATGYSQLVAEFTVTILAYFLAKRLLEFKFPAKSFLINAGFVLPFALITHLVSSFTSNNYVVLSVCALCCGIYFIIYQLYAIKDKFLAALITPSLIKFKTIFLKLKG